MKTAVSGNHPRQECCSQTIDRSYIHSANELKTAPDSSVRYVSLSSAGNLDPRKMFSEMQMKRNALVRNVLSVSLLLGVWGMLGLAQESAGQDAPPSHNTKMNQHDRNPNEPTADQQRNNLSDRD